MIATTTPEPCFAVTDSDVAKVHYPRRRRITPELCKAMEKLGHAIDYLTDEFVREADSADIPTDRLVAMQLIMTLRKEIYLAAPEVLPAGERCRVFLTQLLA
jgi:hypothetical protein